MLAFMREVLPDAGEAERARTAELIKTTLSQVGKHFSETPRSRAEITAYADAMAEMFCAYLEKAGARRRPHSNKTARVSPQ